MRRWTILSDWHAIRFGRMTPMEKEGRHFAYYDVRLSSRAQDLERDARMWGMAPDSGTLLEIVKHGARFGNIARDCEAWREI
jgi:hypothetical protein